jgi:hypothetical protein
VAFESFPNLIYAKVLETSETALGGGFAHETDCFQLAHTVVTLYRHGTLGGSEQLRLKLCHDATLAKTYATSSWLTLSDVDGLSGGGAWIGRLRFDWPTLPHWAEGSRLYLACESASYTRNGTTSYLALMLDWPLPQAVQEDEPSYSWKAEFWGYGRLLP